MKLKFVLIIFSVIIILIIYAVKSCSSMVQSMDGEKVSKMIEISQGYFYNKTDKKIWQYEKKTDSYLNIIANQVDSLSYNSDYIIGYANKQYFIINVKKSNIEYLNNIVDKVEFKNTLFKNILEVKRLL